MSRGALGVALLLPAVALLVSRALRFRRHPTAGAARTLLGLDLGTTSLKTAVVRVTGSPPSVRVVGEVQRTPLGVDRSFESIVTLMASAAERCTSAAGLELQDLDGVGVSQPGHVDPETGCVAAAANLPWRDVPLGLALAAALKREPSRVCVLEDADAAMLAELAEGGAAAAPPEAGATHTAAMFVIGGGVGSSVAIGGQVHRGRSGMIEAGHMLVPGATELCGCGQRGCLETVASATAIVRRARAGLRRAAATDDAAASEEEEAAAQLVQQALDVARLAESGDPACRQAMDEAAEALARACINLGRTLDPHVIVLAGGVATPALVGAVTERVSALAWTILPNDLRIRHATAGADAGVLGAAVHAAATAGAAARRTHSSLSGAKSCQPCRGT